MVLTPEDVISKTFQPTRFAEGYNQDEVDEFLDDVVSTLRALRGQIDELEARLAARVEIKSAPSVAQLAVDGPGGIDAVSGEFPSVAVDDHVTGQDGSGAPALNGSGLGIGEPDGVTSAAGVLMLAQRVHDEYVRSGQKQRDDLVAEARVHADGIISDAEEKRATTLSTLELERNQLQQLIGSLREHEQEYRTRLRSLLQAQLADLESQQSLEPTG